MKHYLLIIFYCFNGIFAEDYYQLLGVDKSADNQEIRRAFKKLALTLHPDKNQNDPEANEKFMKINNAYEILKDAELRKIYDFHGEDGLKDNNKSRKGQSFHSWNYYYENFGIYDDDPEIITLSKTDFDQSVAGTRDVWFINFYSPACSHCHQLAPAWREMARELSGVIRIGAVNCEEDWFLCRNEEIQSYPSLMLYPQGEKYQGSRDSKSLVDYVLRELSTRVLELKMSNFDGYAQESHLPWLISFCSDESVCPSSETLHKLSAMLDGLLHVATLDCINDEKLCTKLNIAQQSGIAYFTSLKDLNYQEISSNDAQDIFKTVLNFLPDMATLDEDEFTQIFKHLLKREENPWLIQFIFSSQSSDPQLRKLPSLLANIKVGRIDCSKAVLTCQIYFVTKHPTFILYKPGGTHEVYHGRLTPQDIAVFVQESVISSVETLIPTDFPGRIVDEGDTWFVDFYAPWCPPCMRLLPELRKASRSVSSNVHFGTVDCTIHQFLCQRYNIRSYPTSILYNRTVPHQYFGNPSAPALVEFVEEILSPSVMTLSTKSFESEVSNRHQSQTWLVDFYAPWCQPCQQLIPHWRKVAKMLSKIPNVHVGQVDCTTESTLCEQQSVPAYPTIRLYPSGSIGSSYFHVFKGWSRDAQNIRAWAFQFLPSKVPELDPNSFKTKILESDFPSLVDFYAPWCGHCQTFAPEFENLAQDFEGRVNFLKVNCEQFQSLCRQAGVSAYPTLRFYPRKKDRNNRDYSGETINSQQSSVITRMLEEKLNKEGEAPVFNRDEL